MNTPLIRRLGALLTVAIVAVACAQPFEEQAKRPNVDVSLELWAMSGSPPSYPAALLVLQYTPVRADPAGSFDLAFDIDANGRLVVLPVARVVAPLTGNRTIGLQRATEFYTLVVEAPRTGWVYDSVLVVNPGTTFLVKVQTPFCEFDIRQDIHAKFYVDSVLPAERRVKLSARVNPNCGLRSFVSGTPTY